MTMYCREDTSNETYFKIKDQSANMYNSNIRGITAKQNVDLIQLKPSSKKSS